MSRAFIKQANSVTRAYSSAVVYASAMFLAKNAKFEEILSVLEKKFVNIQRKHGYPLCREMAPRIYASLKKDAAVKMLAGKMNPNISTTPMETFKKYIRRVFDIDVEPLSIEELKNLQSKS